MKAIEKILVIIDPTISPDPRRQRAFERGLLLARATQAELRLFVVYDYNTYLADLRLLDSASLERAREDFVARRRAALEEAAAELRAGGVRASIGLVWDRPLHDGIVREVLRYRPDVVLKDTHHHSVIARALFTNTDWHLIRECPAPLLLVRDKSWPPAIKVLAAVDPLHERDKPAGLDRRILDVAGGYARACGGELHVAHAYEPISGIVALDGSYVPTIPLPVDDLNEKLEARHAGALEALLEGSGVSRECTHLCAGNIRNELRDVARTLPAALVVMGAVSRSALERVFIGSTAERLLESLPCDVLIVKPEGFHTPVEAHDQEPLTSYGGSR